MSNLLALLLYCQMSFNYSASAQRSCSNYMVDCEQRNIKEPRVCIDTFKVLIK